MWWVKNTDGKPDAVLTFALVGFVVVILKVALTGVVLTFANSSYAFGAIGSDEIAAILTPTLGAYVLKKYVTVKQTEVNHLKETLEVKKAEEDVG